MSHDRYSAARSPIGLHTSLADYEKIDIHYHCAPDLYQRRHDVLAAGSLYQQHNAAVVLTSHLGSTAIQASLGQSLGYPVLPSLVLNDIAGGIDYKVVVRALIEYTPLLPSRLLVHLPTITGRPYRSQLDRQLVQPGHAAISQKPTTVFADHGQLKQEVKDLIRMSDHDPIVLTTGHASKEEIYALVEESSKYPNSRLLLNQPAHPLVGLTAKELEEIALQSQVYIEQTALTYLLGYQDQNDFYQVLNQVPRVIYSSDLGQTSQMDVTEFMQSSRRYFIDSGLTTSRAEDLFKSNPLRMLSV